MRDCNVAGFFGLVLDYKGLRVAVNGVLSCLEESCLHKIATCTDVILVWQGRTP